MAKTEEWPEHFPITGMPIDDIHKLLKSLKKVELPPQVAKHVEKLRTALEEHDTEQAGLSGYRAQARADYQKEGEVEIDDNAVVSVGGDPGAYVMAWVWVEDEE